MNAITIKAVELNARKNNEAFVNGIQTEVRIELTGSEKQIAWAKDIIEMAISAAILEAIAVYIIKDLLK